MKSEDRQILWGLDLDNQEQKQILTGAGPAFTLLNIPADELSGTMELSRSRPPAVTWIPLRLWTSLPKKVRQALGKWDRTQRVLIRDDSETLLSLEDVIEQGFLTVVDKPLTKAKIRGALIKASEVTGLYDDICRMTEEIILERELLRRKGEQLDFLSAVLAEVAGVADAAEILARAESAFKGFLPLLGLGAVFVGEAEDGAAGLEAEIHLPSKLTSPAAREWVGLLLEAGGAVAGTPVAGYRLREVAGPKPARARSLKPSKGLVSRMPLTAGGDYFGCLVLVTKGRSGLARDDVRTLHAAVNHISLALKNALAFGRISTRADYDALTRLHCRGYLETRLREEAGRHMSFGLPLSMLAMDFDGLAQAAEPLGPDAGDAILAEAAVFMSKGLRMADVPARHRGSLLAALLPGTDLEQAAATAERIRTRLEKIRFRPGARAVSLTASIGVACLDPKAQDPATDLEARTLAALAEARGQGNCVRSG